MRKLVASLFVSLDGVIEAPQRWHMPYINEEVGAVLQEQIADSDATSWAGPPTRTQSKPVASNERAN